MDTGKPLVFQSGTYKEEPVISLMFKHYSHLYFLFERMRKNSKGGKNRLHLYLEWLMPRGENRVPVMLCPQCGKRTVRFFFVRESLSGLSVHWTDTSCENNTCQEMMAGRKREQLKFSALRKYQKADQRVIAEEVFLPAFGLERPLTAEKLTEFFAK